MTGTRDTRREKMLPKAEAYRLLAAKIDRKRAIRQAQERRVKEEIFRNLVYLATGTLLLFVMVLSSI